MDPNAHMRILLSHYDRGNIADETGGMVKFQMKCNPILQRFCRVFSDQILARFHHENQKELLNSVFGIPANNSGSIEAGENREEILTEPKTLPVHIIMSILSTSTAYTASTNFIFFITNPQGTYDTLGLSSVHNGTTTMNEDVSPIKNHRRLCST